MFFSAMLIFPVLIKVALGSGNSDWWVSLEGSFGQAWDVGKEAFVEGCFEGAE